MFKPVSVNSYTYISSSLTCPIQFEALLLLWKHVKICEMNWRTFPLLLTPPKAKDPHFDTPSQHVEDFDEVLGRQGGQGAANRDVGVFNGFHLPFFYHFFSLASDVLFPLLSAILSHSQPTFTFGFDLGNKIQSSWDHADVFPRSHLLCPLGPSLFGRRRNSLGRHGTLTSTAESLILDHQNV